MYGMVPPCTKLSHLRVESNGFSIHGVHRAKLKLGISLTPLSSSLRAQLPSLDDMLTL